MSIEPEYPRKFVSPQLEMLSEANLRLQSIHFATASCEENILRGFTSAKRLLKFIAVLLTIITLFLGILITRKAEAQTLRFTFGETWGIAWDRDGNQTEPAINSLFGVGMGFPIADSWTLFGDIVTTTPFTAFHPTLRPTLGIAFRHGRLTLGGSLMWQWNPGYGKFEHSHVLGVTVGPGFIITEGVVVTVGLGYRMKLQGGELVAHILSPGAGLTLLFPL